MNMEEKKSKLFFWGIFPKCPFYKPIPVLIIIAFIALGTWGIFYLNLWVALAYSIYSVLWYFLFMPVVHCQHCYFKVKDIPVNNEKGDTTDFREKDVYFYVRTLVFTYCIYRRFILSELQYIGSGILDMLCSCVGNKLVLYAAKSLHNVPYQRRMSFILLNQNRSFQVKVIKLYIAD